MMDLDGESNSERRKNGTGIAIPTSSGDEVASYNTPGVTTLLSTLVKAKKKLTNQVSGLGF
jgi:hypothetical protein